MGAAGSAGARAGPSCARTDAGRAVPRAPARLQGPVQGMKRDRIQVTAALWGSFHPPALLRLLPCGRTQPCHGRQADGSGAAGAGSALSHPGSGSWQDLAQRPLPDGGFQDNCKLSRAEVTERTRGIWFIFCAVSELLRPQLHRRELGGPRPRFGPGLRPGDSAFRSASPGTHRALAAWG